MNYWDRQAENMRAWQAKENKKGGFKFKIDSADIIDADFELVKPKRLADDRRK